MRKKKTRLCSTV